MSYYAGLANNQHEMLSNLTSENAQIDAHNIEALNKFDTSQNTLKKSIKSLSKSEDTTGGKGDLVEGLPVSQDTVGEVLGGKATYNYVKNVKSIISDAPKKALTGDAFLTESGNAMNDSELTSGARKLGKTATKVSKSLVQGLRPSAPVTSVTPKTVAGAGEGAVSSTEGLRTQTLNRAKTGAKIGTDAEEGLSVAGKAGKLLEGAGAGVSIVSGLELANKDISGLIAGKGWSALGSNTDERIGNLLSLGGDISSVVPGGEIIGGLADLAGAAFNYFGEKKEDDKTNATIKAKQASLKSNKPPPVQANVVSPAASSLGMISNAAHPVTRMIAGSGQF
tara:strand:+ start:4863 stop:5873 length:1011 start_codon:yes stop_codon:yes gene_type:complete